MMSASILSPDWHSLSYADQEASGYHSGWQYIDHKSKFSYLHRFISQYQDTLVSECNTEDTISNDSGSGFIIFKHHRRDRERWRTYLPIYSEIKPTGLRSSIVYVPLTANNITSSCVHISKIWRKNMTGYNMLRSAWRWNIPWVQHISWAAYHVSLLPEPDIMPLIPYALVLSIPLCNMPTLVR